MIKDQKGWEEYVKINDDPYGKACVDVARRVMELLDEQDDFNCHKIICQAEEDVKAGEITGFMAGAVVAMVSRCHSRGEEFRHKWNLDIQIGKEGEEANKSAGVLNPALLSTGPNPNKTNHKTEESEEKT